jgi:type IV secretory pathway VirB10-like protein
MSQPPTYLPPRQPPPPVQRIAKWALITVATVVSVVALYLFFRGTQPRHVKFMEAQPVARPSPLADGWVQGLPDGPVASDPPPKPTPPVDEQARRELLRLQQQMRERDEQINKSLEAINKRLSEQKTAPAKATPVAPPKIQVPPPNSLVLYAYQPPAEEAPQGTGMTAGTVIPVTLKFAINSERQRVVVASVREHIRDSRNPQQIIIPQYAKVITDMDPANIIAGEERVDLSLTRIELPNRHTIELPKEPVVDQIGQGGLTGEVDRKWRYVIPAILARGVFAASVQHMTTIGSPALNSLQADGRQIGQTIINPYINVRPTIRVEEGERAALVLTKDLPLPVYQF